MNNYLQAGVNLNEATRFVSEIKQVAKKTYNSAVIGGLGGFAGLFKLPGGYQNPVLVSCTDGVGSKLKLAYQNQCLHNIGQDLVAMCLNDLLCSGAKPLFFLDYLATASLKTEEALIIAKSIGQACEATDTVLLGGETAELPGMLPPNGYELAGFAVGIVEEQQILNPKQASAEDILLALPSSGAHSNGFSLIRKIIDDQKLPLKQALDEFDGNTLLQELMKPTILYNKILEPILPKIKSVAHITGGGLPENLPRAFGDNLQAQVNFGDWQIPPIFNFLQKHGGISPQEMLNVFNMGIGLVLIISAPEKKNICDYLEGYGQAYFEIGKLVHKNKPAADSNFVLL